MKRSRSEAYGTTRSRTRNSVFFVNVWQQKKKTMVAKTSSLSILTIQRVESTVDVPAREDAAKSETIHNYTSVDKL